MIYLEQNSVHTPNGTQLTLGVSVGPVSQSETFILGNAEQITLQANGGRMAILDVEAPGSVQQVDGKYALNLASVTAAETRRFTTAGGTQVTLEIAAPKQLAGWGEGTHYMLERDATETIVLEPGRNHRKLYVTAGAHGYTKAEIAAEVGGGMTEEQVTNAWLKAQTVYGGSPEKALDAIPGVLFWNYITANKAGVPANKKQSNWLLLERGYQYDMGSLASAHFMPEGVDGESALHPCVVMFYGTGKEPIMGGVGPSIRAFSNPRNVVFHGVSIGGTGGTHASGEYILYSDLVTEPGPYEVSFGAGTSYRTLYRCAITDIHHKQPLQGLDWSRDHPDRIFGMFANGCQHLLIEDPFNDLNGWRPGYAVQDVLYSVNPNQPPSIYSHGFYLSFENRDVTLTGGIISRGASLGYQMRSGGRSIDNVLIDNNQHATEAGGGVVTEGIPSPRKGNYTLMLGNVMTSAGYKTYQGADGAKNIGADVQSGNVVTLDNIICHRANPNDPAEIAAKPKANKGVYVKDYTPGVPTTEFEFDNTISYNWEATNKRVEGLNTATLNATTIQNFAATKLPGGTAPTIPNFMAWMRERTPRERQLIQREMLDYFRAPYASKLELPAVKRTTPAVCVFRPDPRCEGFLWENPMNWSTGDLPGTVAGDTVDLHGNFVRFNRLTVSIPINFNGGKLDVVSGKLTCTEQTGVADVTVRNSGQYFAPAGGDGDYIAAGGRLAFVGAATVDLEVAGNAECLLGPNLTITEGTIYGADCWVGWDGTGAKTATANLSFLAVDGKLGKIQRFRRRGDDPEPTATGTINLTGLYIDTTGVAPGTSDLGGGDGTGVTYVNSGATLPAGANIASGKLTQTV